MSEIDLYKMCKICTYRRHRYVHILHITEAVITVKMLLMMSDSIARNM